MEQNARERNWYTEKINALLEQATVDELWRVYLAVKTMINR